MVKGGDPTTDNYVVTGGSFDVPIGLDEEQNAVVDGFGCLKARTEGGGFEGVVCFSAKDHGADAAEDIAPTLRAGGHDESHANAGVMPAVAIRTAQTGANGHCVAEEVAHTLDGAEGQAVAFAENCRSEVRTMDIMPALATGGGKPGVGYPAIQTAMAVRRLTPRECERLQAFPDDWTLVEFRGKPAADGPRYKSLGNAVTVNVIEWIAGRIAEAEKE